MIHAGGGDSMLTAEKKKALSDLVGESVAERLISTMQTREKEAQMQGVSYKGLDVPTADEIAAILGSWDMKGNTMPTDETLKQEKAEGEEMAEETVVEEAEEMDEEEGSDEESLLSEAEIKAIAKAVAEMISGTMKEMSEELKGYMGKREKDDSAIAHAEAQVAALEEMVKTIKEVSKRLEALEAVAGKPYRPSEAGNNVLGQNTTTKSADVPAGLDPQYHDAYRALADMNLFR
jgi:DNA repair exonuclease SbcCD ATPase subunit